MVLHETAEKNRALVYESQNGRSTMNVAFDALVTTLFSEKVIFSPGRNLFANAFCVRERETS